jgi:protein-S-isoprenylcysteine O-methyltransferase Ste14
MVEEPSPTRNDPLLLLEAVLVVLLVVLFIVLYFIPIASDSFLPEWWAWIVLAILFFGVLALDSWRRRKRRREELHRAIREGADTEG